MSRKRPAMWTSEHLDTDYIIIALFSLKAYSISTHIRTHSPKVTVKPQSQRKDQAGAQPCQDLTRRKLV
jgi:hypothetical protein